MEKLKVKHDHKLTDILKVLIFAIFLMMPFFTYAPTALYYGVNEYATNNTTTNVDIQYKYQSNEVDSINDLVGGNVYYTPYICFTNISNEYYFELTILQCDSATGLDRGEIDEIYVVDYSSLEYEGILIGMTSGSDSTISYYLTNGNAYTGYYYSFNDDTIEFTNAIFYVNEDTIDDFINYYSDSEYINNIGLPYFTSTDFNVIESVDIEENVEQTISQQMYNSWQTMWETPMYNWTNNSILKTGLDNFTGVFGVNNNSYITNLITYELIIVTIYIVIDIVLTLFKWLTHMVGSKE